jgi:hypothetical protein
MGAKCGVTLRGECKLQVIKNEVLREIFALDRNEEGSLRYYIMKGFET